MLKSLSGNVYKLLKCTCTFQLFLLSGRDNQDRFQQNYQQNRGQNWKTVHYSLVICRVSSTGHIYHRAAKHKCDRSMTLGKLLDNNAVFHFYFYSNNDPTSPKGPRKQTTEPILGKKKKNSYNWLNGKAWLGLLPVRIYWEIMPSAHFVMQNFWNRVHYLFLHTI